MESIGKNISLLEEGTSPRNRWIHWLLPLPSRGGVGSKSVTCMYRSITEGEANDIDPSDIIHQVGE